MNRYTAFFIAGALAAGTSHAQQSPLSRDTIRGAVVEVYQTYTPEIKLAPRPTVTPVLPPVDTTRPVLTYEVPQQTLHYTYRSLPLRPLALGRDTTPLPPQNFVRAGGGSRGTAYGEVGIGSVGGADWQSTLHLRHFSQHGPLKYQAASNTDAQATVRYGLQGHLLSAGLTATHNRYGYYGYNDRVAGTLQEPHVRFTGIRVHGGIETDSSAVRSLTYSPRFTASLYVDNFETTERTAALSIPLRYALDSGLHGMFEIAGTATRLRRADGPGEGNNIFALRPGFEYGRNGFDARFILSPTFGDGVAYLLPDVRLSYRIASAPVTLAAGWEATLTQNTYEQLSTRNPFTGRGFAIRQTRDDAVWGQVGAGVGKHFSFSVRGGWRGWRGLPLFVNSFDNTAFGVVYDGDVRAVQIQGEARYAIGETFSVGVHTLYTSFYRHSQARVWHEPGLRTGADATFTPLQGLRLRAYAVVLDRIAAPDEAGRAVWLKPVVDVGLGGEYSFTDRFSGFARVDNLFNSHYERWRGYPAFGTAFWAGLGYRF